MRTILGYLCYAFPFILLLVFAAIAMKEHGGFKALLSLIAIVGITFFCSIW